MSCVYDLTHLGLPRWQFVSKVQSNLCVRARQAKVFYPGVGERALLHDPVRWRSCPTCGDREASHALTNDQGGADHVRGSTLEGIRFLSLDREPLTVPLFICRHTDHSVKKPLYSAAADRVVGGTQSQIIGKVMIAGIGRTRVSTAQHFGPDLIELGHMARIGVPRPKGNFVISSVYKVRLSLSSFMRSLATLVLVGFVASIGISQTNKSKPAGNKPKQTSTAAKPKPTPAAKQVASKPKANASTAKSPAPKAKNTASAGNTKSSSLSSKNLLKNPTVFKTADKKPAANTSAKKAAPANADRSSNTSAKTPDRQRKATTASKSMTKSSTPKKPVEPQLDEAAEWERIAAISDAMEHVAALRKFLRTFPATERRTEALTTITGIEAAAGNEKLGSNDISGAVDLYKAAIDDAPAPMPEAIFNDLLSKVPANLFFRGAGEAAFTIAKALEAKVLTNATQLLSIANFYLSIENGTEAKRVAEVAAQVEPGSSAAEQTLGLAARMDFQLDASAAHYAKALELDPDSIAARRGLAEMKRSMGKPEEAVVLYREILAKDDANVPARTGLILSMFEAGDRQSAEKEMAQSLESNPGNIILLAGAAYWYAVHNEGPKAVEYAQKAIAQDPRFIWSHIALARGYLISGKPAEAEKTLLMARRYGNFPTVEYELAASRMAGGFYRDAAEGLAKTFSIKDGVIHANLGGRVPKESKYFTELVGFERRASIFAPTAADSPEAAARMAALLELKQLIDAEKADADAIARATDDFVKGDDRMKVHRQLYAASLLLDKKVALPKVLDLTRAAVANIDVGLDIPNPASAVMASELFANRTVAAAKGEYLNVPEVTRSTLSAIMRGRVEEISGWAQYQMDKPEDAVVRLKRAISVLPVDSAWWRSTTWRLGAALAATGKDAEALDWYIRSYKSAGDDALKYAVIETIYRKVNGSSEGLEAKVGSKPASPAAIQTVSERSGLPASSSDATATSEVKAEPSPSPAEVTDAPIKLDIKATPEPTAATSEPVKAAGKPTPEPVETEKAPEKLITKPTSEKPATPADKKVVTEPSPDLSPERVDLPVATVKPTPSPAVDASSRNAKPEPTPEVLSEESKTTVAATVEKKDPVRETTEIPAPKPTPEKQRTELLATNTAGKELFPPVVITIPTPQRTRVVPENGPRACKVTVSDESVTVRGGGDDLAIMVGVEGDQRIDDIKAVSSSPDDITVQREAIPGLKTRALFIIKPVSERVGTYQVSFEMPCGKKSIQVKLL